MRLLQVPLLLPEHAVDAPADFPRLPLGLALLSAQLVGAPPLLFLRVCFGPRALQAPTGARRELGPCRVSPSRWGRGRGPGQARPRTLRGRFRARAGGILQIPEEQRSQTVAQTHVGSAPARETRRDAGTTGARLRPGPQLRGGRGLHLDPGRGGGRPEPRATAPHSPEGPFCIFRWEQGVTAAWAGDHLITPRAGRSDWPPRARPSLP